MDDEYQNSKNLAQEPDTEQVNEVQTVSEVSDEIPSSSPESADSSIDSEKTLSESSDIVSETVDTPVDPVSPPSEASDVITETSDTREDSLENSTENHESVLTASLEIHEEEFTDSPVLFSSQADESVVPLDGNSSETDVLKPGEVADRDDYCTGEPPKLKYYDEAERQEEINKYKKFKKVDGETYRKVNVFLRKRTYITAREWALARLCADFKTPYGSEMTFIGEHLPELCPFMQEPYSPQAVNQARTSFKRKVRKSAATFLYGAMCGFFTPEELDDILFEANEVSKFFLEIEGTSLELDEEIDIEDKISAIMKGLGSSARSILKTRMTDEDEDDEDEVIVVPVEESVKESKSVESEGELADTETKVDEEEKESVSSEKEEDTSLQ